MFSLIHKSRTQKKLFFQLDTEFKKSSKNKICGIYAIFRDDICLYVGQSHNIASRLATHLSGKYKDCTEIYIYESFEYDEFDLGETEKFVMKKLEPSENIQIDFSYKINRDKLAESDLSYAYDYCELKNINHDIMNDYSYIIINNNDYIFISDSEISSDLDYFDEALIFLGKTINRVIEAKRL